MRITKNQLRTIIKEEMKRVLNEGFHSGEQGEWEVVIELDYNKEPAVEWNIRRQGDTILKGSDEQLDLNSLKVAIKKLQQKYPDDTETLDDAYSEASDSFKAEAHGV